MTGADRARLVKRLRVLRARLLRANDRWLATVERGDFLAALREIDGARDMAEEIRVVMVALARAEGATWQQIADSLGVGLTVAYKRFARPKK